MLKEELTRPLSASDVISHLLGALVAFTFVALYIWLNNNDSHLIDFILLFWIPAVLLHELAHAVTGTVLGGYVSRIKLGLTTNPTGKHLSFRFLSFPWELYSIPLTGIVLMYFSDPHRYRTRVGLMTSAGPLASLIAAASGILPLFCGVDRSFKAPLAGWFLANIYFFLGTEIPYYRNHKGKTSQTDGHRLWKLLRQTDDEIKKKCVQARLQIELKRDKEEIRRLSIEETIARYNADPESIATLLRLIDKLGHAKDSRQVDYVNQLISHPQIAPGNFAKFLDSYIMAHLMEGTINNDPRFDQFSEKLVTASNQSITTLGTRGSVLIDLGRIEEGVALLKDVLAKTESPLDKVYSHVFLALAAKAQGNHTLARDHAENARRIDPNCQVLKRISDLLPAKPEDK